MGNISQFIQNHWQMALAFVIISLLIFINELISMKKQGKTVSPEKVVDLINNENAVIFDLRAPALFKAGHIINSVRATEADFDMPKMNKYKDKIVILACARGLQAATVAKKLLTKGYPNTMVLAGGIEAWKALNMPLVKK